MCGRQPGDSHQGKNGDDNSEQDLGLPGLNSRVRAMRPPRVPYSRARKPGDGNQDSFESAAHGAGRRMLRTDAKAAFDLDDVELQTEGVECRKDAGGIDELPGAYKDIDEVMENQKDLVEIVETLKQIVCVKG